MKYETAVLIPTYNGKHLLNECLEALKKQTYRDFAIVIVDDASTDNTEEYLKKNFPDIDVLRSETNSGFAQTVNKGIRYILRAYAPAYIAMLNNDTRVDAEWLASLVSRIKQNANVAAITSNMLFWDHPNIINSQGGTLDWNGDGYDINFGIAREKGKKESREVIGACFGASLIRAVAFQKIGLLDETFGAYFEDLDWSWRAHLYNYHVIFEPRALVYHKHSATYKKMPYKKLYLCKKNALRTAIKNYEAKNLPHMLAYILIGYWFAIVGYFQKDKYQFSFAKKFIFISIPIAALLWNIAHLASTLKERSQIQQKRVVGDEIIFALAAQNFTPVRMWIKNLKAKFSLWRFFIPIVEHTKHSIVLPFFNLTTHKIVLPVVYKIKNLNDQLMTRNILGKISQKNFFRSADAETVDIYMSTVLANLPFRLACIKKDDFFKNESALVIDACILCLQLSCYKEPHTFGRIPQKIKDAAEHLAHTSLNWNTVMVIGAETNAFSQLYFYLRLLETQNKMKYPRDIMGRLKKRGSRIQNMLLDRISLQKLLSGTPSFFLKVYAKMYLEIGPLKYVTSKMHAWYNNEFHFSKKENTSHNIHPPHKNVEKNDDYTGQFTRYGVNIFGFLDSESGVGEASRSFIRAIDRTHIPYALINSDRAPHRRHETQFSKKFGKENPYAVNLIVIYGDMFENELRAFGKEKFEHHYNIAYWAWELSSLPDAWTALLNTVDEVWTPSAFSASTISKAKRNIPITVIPHAIETGKMPYSRAHFSLPKDRFLFLFMFDFYSIFERKNPLAVIHAFKEAFDANDRVGLVIKCSNAHVDQKNFEKLKREASDSRIILINQYLARDEISSLMNVCDCLVSLHRSEGFGLTIAEAMAMEKPVIATNYSGNVDFMNEKNSFRIPYTLVALEHDYGPYKKGNVWADPNIKKASEIMRLVVSQQDIASLKAASAREYITQHLSPEAISQLIMKRLNKI